mgnify:CR=1 FL=1
MPNQKQVKGMEAVKSRAIGNPIFYLKYSFVEIGPNRSLAFKLFVRAITFILILLSYVKCKNVIIMGK